MSTGPAHTTEGAPAPSIDQASLDAIEQQSQQQSQQQAANGDSSSVVELVVDGLELALDVTTSVLSSSADAVCSAGSAIAECAAEILSGL